MLPLLGHVTTTPDATVEAIVTRTLELTAIPAPTGDEGARADAVAAGLAAAGLEVVHDEVGNVIGRAPGTDPQVPAIVVSAHLDTVFGAEEAVLARRDGDRLLGPGIGDNTVALAVLEVLAEDLAAAAGRSAHLVAGRSGDIPGAGADERSAPARPGRAPAVPLVLVATVGEEGMGDLRGVKHLLRTMPVRGFVALEGHLLDSVVTGGIGAVRLRARHRGRGGHSWGDIGTPSAAHSLVRACTAALDAVPAGRHVNLGVVRAGSTVNAIAESAEVLVDLRDEDAERLERTVAVVVAALERADRGVRAELERVGRRPAGRTPDDDPLVRAVRSARGDVGLPPVTEAAGSTEVNAAFPAGIPAICVGVTRGGDMHRPSEWIEIPPIADGMAMVRALLRRLGAL
ncbi:MAG: M20/M25/M40 family metallo-hydrolase [Solirubrobacteraceae bacterium]